MKTFLAIVVTAAVTWITFSVIHSVRAGVERLWMVSAVKAPGEMALSAIQADMNAGRYDLAKAKVDAFADTWRKFGGDSDACRGNGIGNVMVVFSKIDTDYQTPNRELGGSVKGSRTVRAETNSTSAAAGSAR